MAGMMLFSYASEKTKFRTNDLRYSVSESRSNLTTSLIGSNWMRSAYFIAVRVLANCCVDAGEVQVVCVVLGEQVVMPVSGHGMFKFEDKLPAGHCLFQEGAEVDSEGRFKKNGEVLDGEDSVIGSVFQDRCEHIPGLHGKEFADEVFILEGLCKQFTQIYIGDARDVFLGEDESC